MGAQGGIQSPQQDPSVWEGLFPEQGEGAGEGKGKK